MCMKQTSVSHNSTEAEIISLDAGLRMDGIPAPTLWDLMIQVFHSEQNKNRRTQERATGKPVSNRQVKHALYTIPIKHTNVIPTNIGRIPSNTKKFWFQWLWKVEVPQWDMFHWPTELFDGMNLVPKIQIRYIDTKHQLADMLTKGNYLFNVSHSSSTCCTKNFNLISCSTVAKRIQNQKGSRKSCVQVATGSDEHVSFFDCDKLSLIASKSPGMPIASGKPDSRIRIEPRSVDAASTSQVRLKDAYFCGLMEEQRGDPSHQEEENSEDSDNPAAETWYYKEEPVAQNSTAWQKPLAHGASSAVSWPGKSKEHGSDKGALSPLVAGQIALHGCRLLHGL